MTTTAEKIRSGSTFLGIELGSTRIKACLIDETGTPLSVGSHTWENRYENGFWTYSLSDIRSGFQACYADLAAQVTAQYGVSLSTVGSIGVSGMMHGYLPFDRNGNLLTPFRTWRNTTTAEAADRLSRTFHFNIPQRWSVAHVFQAIRNGEEHVADIAFLTTLSGYIHFLLTGKRELGIGDASGMFPLSGTDYDETMLKQFDELTAPYGIPWKLRDILPTVRTAGETGAVLTKEGAAFLDPTGTLSAGIPVCPPEGDGGTGMVATNSVSPKTGNISAGTSAFSMLVLEKPLHDYYPEIDVVVTPEGFPVAMVHCNNCCGEIDAWVRLFGEFAELSGHPMEMSDLYRLLYENSQSGDRDAGRMTAYNCLSSEPVTGVTDGYPMHIRRRDSRFNLANFFLSELYGIAAPLTMGMRILTEKEGVFADHFTVHGGLFKVPGVAQQVMADALQVPISVTATAGEGGAYGMALLAAYMVEKNGQSLGDWLRTAIFATSETTTLPPDEAGSAGFRQYMADYVKGLQAVKALASV